MKGMVAKGSQVDWSVSRDRTTRYIYRNTNVLSNYKELKMGTRRVVVVKAVVDVGLGHSCFMS